MSNKLISFALAAAFVSCAARVEAASTLVVGADEDVTLATNAVYDVVSIAGSFTLKAKLTVNDACYVTGAFTNAGDYNCPAGVTYLGYDGQPGAFVAAEKTYFNSRYVDVGTGDADGCTMRLAKGATVACRSVRKYGTGAATIAFAGGAVNFNAPALVVEKGDVILESVDANAIEFYATMAGHQPFLSESGEGRIFTRGDGAVLFRIMTEKGGMTLTLPSQGVNWGHGGGFRLKNGIASNTNAVFSLNGVDFFATNGLPSAVQLEGQAILNARGKTIRLRTLTGAGHLENGTYELVGTGGDETLSDSLTWAEDATLSKLGAETLTLDANSLPRRLIAGGGTLATPGRLAGAPWKHYRFKIDKTAAASDYVQLSEFRLLRVAGGVTNDVTAMRSGYSFGEGANDRAGANQDPGKILDGLLNTKWLTKTGIDAATEEQRSNCWVQVSFAVPQCITHYDWATANDSKWRDPAIWRLLASNDGVNWTELDGRNRVGQSDYARLTWTGPWAVPGVYADFASISVTGGTFRVANQCRAASVVQAAPGVVALDADGCLRLTDGRWADPAFVANAAGRVESAASDAATNVFSLSSGVAVVEPDFAAVSGTTRFLQQGTKARLFRFTIKKTYSDAVCTQLSRFRLFDAAGKDLALGLAMTNPGTAPASLPAGTCAYAGNYSQGGSSKVQHLFDGNTSTKMCLTSLSMGGAPEDNTWRIVHFRLAAEVTAVATSYQLTSANDNAPSRNPVVWTLEGSLDDGATWEMLDSRDVRNAGDGTTTSSVYSDFNGGTPFLMRAAVAAPDAVTFRKSVSVAAGATLDVGTDPACCSLAALAIDLDAGAGAFTAFTPAANGALHLAAASAVEAELLELPLQVGALASAANLRSWRVELNGAVKKGWRVFSADGKLYVRPGGTVLVVR